MSKAGPPFADSEMSSVAPPSGKVLGMTFDPRLTWSLQVNV
jgi:hypothetical protein